MNERQEPRAFLRVLTWPSREVGTAHCLAENACVAHSDTHEGQYTACARAHPRRGEGDVCVCVSAQRRLRERWLNIKEGKR